ncbi:MAG: tRNA uridine-5-carboxymethylaminomethyl(34) synthesis GTPase MnmE, partial [Bacteroidales bacterium]|nr:tRNA uridine-5-carboxymethylaminomethyl(34) synthesis GTPase MnmE [Bacteroidales bacterium]
MQLQPMEHPEVNDTICAISTPPGVGGIAVARVSGPLAIDCVSKIWKGTDLHQVKSHTAHLGDILEARDGASLDQAVVTIFRAPRSFTGEDTVEISVHGSQYVQRELIKLLTEAGARLAGPGEFTRRAFASGRFDLAEAEAVADLIAARSRSAHRLAMSQMRGQLTQRLDQLRDQLIELASLLELELDFSEEDVEFASRSRLASLANDTIAEVEHLLATFSTGQAIKQGIPVAIVGATNAGKSTLLNLLVGDDRAIVSDIHGTTRDTVEDTVEIHGALYRIIDTAGIRDTADPIEALGIERSRQAVARARVVIALLDSTAPLDPQLAAR